LQTQGGDYNIGKLITKLESQHVGDTLTSWLKSIPKKPKAFKLKMRPINELLDINVKSIFMQSATSDICQRTETRKCTFGTTMNEFQESFDRRRKSLEFAIELFRHKVYNFFCVILYYLFILFNLTN
jgi:hypothetical protein